MPAVSVVGAVVTNTDVEQAVLSTIEAWVQYYLPDIANQRGVTVPSVPSSYNGTYDENNWPEGALPNIAVICPGTEGDPIYYGDGNVGSWFKVEIGAHVSEGTEQQARATAGLYQAAIATLLVQQALLAGGTDVPFSTDTRFLGWELELPDESNRTLAIGRVTINVLVDSIFNTSAGWNTLPAAPPAAWPLVEKTNVTVAVTPISD